jgi:hypothetical protein
MMKKTIVATTSIPPSQRNSRIVELLISHTMIAEAAIGITGPNGKLKGLAPSARTSSR